MSFTSEGAHTSPVPQGMLPDAHNKTHVKNQILELSTLRKAERNSAWHRGPPLRLLQDLRFGGGIHGAAGNEQNIMKNDCPLECSSLVDGSRGL